jgi:hypothetical protein
LRRVHFLEDFIEPIIERLGNLQDFVDCRFDVVRVFFAYDLHGQLCLQGAHLPDFVDKPQKPYINGLFHPISSLIGITRVIASRA